MKGKASDIFSELDLEHWFIQKEIISIFVKGLKSINVARKVMNSNPKTLDQAVHLANEADERQVRLRAHGLDTRRQEEDMEVEEVSKIKPSHRQQNSTGNKPANKWQDGKPICNHCGKVGHFYRDCYQRQNR